jgi:hypothetical protein
MPKQLTVTQMVAAAVHPTKFGYQSWIDRLPPDLKAEFEQAREDWNPSIIRQAAYARAVIEVARLRGVDALPTFDTVCRWLRAKQNRA